VIVAGLLFLLVSFLLMLGLALWADRRRRQAMADAARRLGWPFEPTAPGMLEASAGYRLFEQGHERKAGSLMRGRSGPFAVDVFDFQYQTGSGGDSDTYTQTVAHIRLDGHNLPAFSVRPENVVNRLVAASVGAQDVNLPAHPAFSKQFSLRGPDEAALHARFPGPVAQAFTAHRGLSADGGGDHLFVFRESRLVKPAEIPAFVAQAVAIAQAFVGG
jgi:hypothetical protein